MVFIQPAAVDRRRQQYFFWKKGTGDGLKSTCSAIQNQTTVVLIHLKYTLSV